MRATLEGHDSDEASGWSLGGAAQGDGDSVVAGIEEVTDIVEYIEIQFSKPRLKTT